MILGMAGHSRGVLVVDWLLLVALLGGARLSLRIWRGLWPARRSGARAVLVIGAGAAGERVVREVLADPRLRYRPVGFLDDDPDRRGVKIHAGSRCWAASSTWGASRGPGGCRRSSS